MVGIWIRKKGKGRTYSDEFISDNLHPDQLAHEQDIVPIAIDAQQERDGVEEVPEHELDGEVFRLLRVERADVKVMPPPRQDRIDDAQQRQNAQQRRDNHARDLQAQPPPIRERMQRVGGALLVFHGRDDDAARCEGLLGLWVAELGDGEGGGDGHDAAGDEGLRVDAHEDVGSEDGAGDGGEAAGHDLVEFGIGEVRDEGADEDGGLALADEGGGGGDDGFGARDVHGVEEEVGEFGDEELEGAEVVEELHEGDEEDDGGDDVEEEPV